MCPWRPLITSCVLFFVCLFVSGGKQQSSHRRREPESHQAHPVDEEACISLFYPSSPSLCHHTHTLTAHRQNSVQRIPHPHPSSVHVLLCELMHKHLCIFCSVWLSVVSPVTLELQSQDGRQKLHQRGSDWPPIAAVCYQKMQPGVLYCSSSVTGKGSRTAQLSFCLTFAVSGISLILCASLVCVDVVTNSPAVS